MDILSVIEKKKQGKPLTEEEIAFFVRGAADGTLPDYQLAALLMAIRLMGMDAQETACLTLAMAHSGPMLSCDVGGIPVDKHSTGGIGDNTTLVAVPLVAACGGKAPIMSGRGLGHTGGTLDKLESIPGFRVEMPEEEFLQIVRDIGCAVIGQSESLVPADKRLYALRDVTGTVDSVPLIASSILSKKFAAGAKTIVLDVKTGSGALMPTFGEALHLAQTMAQIGRKAGRRIEAVISGMDEPLGSHVGNALEIREAIEILSGRETGPLLQLSLYLAKRMMVSSGLAKTEQEASARLNEALHSGAGLQKFREMIIAQGGDSRVCLDPGLLPRAPHIVPLLSESEGYLSHVDGVALGLTAQAMGAGRAAKDDVIDPAVGFVMEKRIGDPVKKGDVICTLHAKDAQSAESAGQRILKALSFSISPVPKARLLYALVTPDGVTDIPDIVDPLMPNF